MTPLVVRVLLAQRRLALVRVADERDAVVGRAEVGERVLDELLGAWRSWQLLSGRPRRWCSGR